MNLEEHIKKLNEEKLKDDSGKYIYPLTIINDRYGGVYSGGKYTAWKLYYNQIPGGVDGDDISCSNFWGDNEQNETYVVGLGKTPDESLEDLCLKLKKKNLYKPI